MSVIQRIRDKAAWFVFGAIALSLIAFILQDAFMRNKGGGQSTSSTLGEVNGVKINREDFENKLSFYEQRNGTSRDQLIGGVWDYMVDQSVMQQAYASTGLQFTSKELSEALFGEMPPSWLQQAFTDPATGVYNVNGAREFFAQLKKNTSDPRIAQITPYLDETTQQTLRQKYQALITGAVYVPKWVAEKTNADNNSMAKVSYVYMPYNSISDSTVKVTDDEIKAYVSKHPKQFEQKEETRQISYVNFDASPSAEDSAAVVNQLGLLKNDFATTQDVKLFLTKNGTELPYYDSYISKSEIKQKVNDSIFALPVGGLYGPYLDGANYVVARLVGEKQMADSVKVRHILVATHQQQQQGGPLVRVRDDSAASKRLDSAVAEIKAGASFDSVCAKYSDDGNRDKGGVYDYFTTGKMVEPFNDFVFEGATGDKKVVQTSYGYHYIEILGQKGSQPAYKFAYLGKPIVASQETVNAANTASTQFAGASKDKSQFDAAAAKLNKEPMVSAEIKQNDYTIPTIGDNRQMVKWIFDNNVGDISAPFQVNDKYIVAVITGINKAGTMGAASARPTVEPILRNEKKAQQIINAKIKGTTLDEIAKAAGSFVQVADSISFQAFVVSNVGNEPKMIGAAFNKANQGKVSIPLAGTNGVFVLRGESIFAGSSLGGNAETIRASLETQLKSQAGYRSLNALREAAVVKDYRSDFY